MAPIQNPRASYPRNKACPRRDCLERQCCLHDPCEGDFGSGWVTVDGMQVAYEFDKDFGHVLCWSPDALDVRSSGVTKSQAIENFRLRVKHLWHKTRINRIRCLLEEACDRQLRTAYPVIDLRGDVNLRSEVYAALNELERHLTDESQRIGEHAGSEMLLLPEAKSKGSLRATCAGWLRKAADLLQYGVSGKVRLREQMLE